MQARSGTYALIGVCDSNQQVIIGKLGQLQVRPGYYVYIGSAFGPGGLKARIVHHTRISVRPHWHIDYLRPALHLIEVWYSYDSERREHQWANALYHANAARIPMAGFGASDCSCPSHLFRFNRRPPDRLFRKRLNGDLINCRTRTGPIGVDSSPLLS